MKRSEPETPPARDASSSPMIKKVQKDTEGYPIQILATDKVSRIERYREQYQNKTLPFPAVPMDGLFDEAFLKQVREECIDNLEASVKKSDLYEKLQSIDIAEISRKLSTDTPVDVDTKSMKHVLALYKMMQSDEFRKVLCDVTGNKMEDVDGDVDATVHIYGKGHHLLPHDDNIGNRKIAYIIYLTDPEDPWMAVDGGHLELYPLDGEHPSSEPSMRLQPSWNRMSIFTVVPNVSWHAVEEIRSATKLRMSIQGWFHSKVKSMTKEDPTVDHIIDMRDELIFQEKAKDLPSEGEPVEESDIVHEASCLSSDDLVLLGDYLNPVFLERNVLEQMRSTFLASNGILYLRDFLKDTIATEKMAQVFDAPKINASGSASVTKYPEFQRFRVWEKDHPMVDLQTVLFDTPTFRRFMTELTGLEPADQYVTEARQFRRGNDYSLAVAPSPDSRLDSTYVLVDDRSDAKKAQWIAAEVGGFEVLVPALTDEGDASVAEQDGETLTLETSSNSLTIVLRPEETPAVRYVKFLRSDAPSDRYEVSNEYRLKIEEGSFEEYEEQEEQEEQEETH